MYVSPVNIHWHLTVYSGDMFLSCLLVVAFQHSIDRLFKIILIFWLLPMQYFSVTAITHWKVAGSSSWFFFFFSEDTSTWATSGWPQVVHGSIFSTTKKWPCFNGLNFSKADCCYWKWLKKHLSSIGDKTQCSNIPDIAAMTFKSSDEAYSLVWSLFFRTKDKMFILINVFILYFRRLHTEILGFSEWMRYYCVLCCYFVLYYVSVWHIITTIINS